MLEHLGLTPSAEELYERLLADRSVSLTDGHAEDEGAIAALVDAGLAVRLPEDYKGNVNAEEPRLVAVEPDDGLGNRLLEEERRITEERERLLTARREFAAVREIFAASRNANQSHDLVQVLVGRDAIGAAHLSLTNGAKRELSLLDTAHFDTPPEPAIVIDLPDDKAQFGAIRYRTIYDHSIYTEHPEYMRYMLSESQAAGEVQRIVPRLPLKMALADESLALVALTPTGMDGAMLVRSKRLLLLLRDLFESLWDEATPLSETVGLAADEHVHRVVPALLAAGLGDDAIARQLGVSLRTVRRRVAEMSDELGAQSRFQAGVLAERQGHIPRG